MDWELYVDESGSFEANKQCLVGGFLCPAGTVSESVLATWKYDILHDPCVIEAAEQFGNWNYDHCCKNTNPTSGARGILQTCILHEYLKRIREIGGKLVIFDNPTGVFDTDNTTNFLTVLAKGLMMLFYDLQGNMTSLTVHFASRRNNTRQDDPEALKVSPTKVTEKGLTDGGTILSTQYANVIKHLAFLHGGQPLLNNDVFSKMINNIHIIPDKYFKVDYEASFVLRGHSFVYVGHGGDYDSKPHPLTVPCDYICNTYFKKNSFIRNNPALSKLENDYSGDNCLLYRIDRPAQLSKQDDFESKDLTGQELLRLISQGLPEPATSNYFKAMNSAGITLQRSIIDVVVNGLKDQVASQTVMRLLIDRIEQAIETAEYIKDSGLKNYYIANLLLFLQSLYTHLGDQKKVTEISISAHERIEALTNSTDKDNLLDIADNRHIVDLTDVFDYDAAMKQFDRIDKYWEDLIKLNSRRTEEKPHYPVYGAALGSYLQVLRHVIHSCENEEDRKLYYEEARERYAEYLWHFEGRTKDLSRCHQIISDIEAEANNFDESIMHLYKAAQYDVDIDRNSIQNQASTEEMSKMVLSASGIDGSKNPYLLQHLVRTCALITKNDPADERLDKLLGSFMATVEHNLGDTIHAPHPKTQIQWKTASILAYRASSTAEQHQLANTLFNSAAKELQLYGVTIFSAIAVAVKAEQALHIIEKRIPGNALTALKNLSSAYSKFLEQKEEASIDPFESYFASKNIEVPELVRIISSIGY